MDFKGQKLSDRLSQFIVCLFAVLGFLVGYVLQDLSVMMKIFGGGVSFAFVATVLDWPMFNTEPVVWLKPAQQAGAKPTTLAARRRKKSRSVLDLFK